MRETQFVNGMFYHVYNRGVDKRNTFVDSTDRERFLQSMKEFNTLNPIGSIYEKSLARKKLPQGIRGSRASTAAAHQKLVNFVAYCINPNHYHFILEQVMDKGIEKFMHRLGTGYTKYFNARHKRSGGLFGGKFKSISIDSNEYLLYLSAYINLNNKVHRLGIENGSSASTIGTVSSWDEYIGNSKESFCVKNIILKQFENVNEYRNFAESALDNILEHKDLYKELEELFSEKPE
jgi:REP element-mobilizing transposase RayT